MQAIGCVVSLFMVSAKMTGFMIGTVPVIIGCGAFIGSFLRSLSKSAQAQVGIILHVFGSNIGLLWNVFRITVESCGALGICSNGCRR